MGRTVIQEREENKAILGDQEFKVHPAYRDPRVPQEVRDRVEHEAYPVTQAPVEITG